MEPRFDHDFSRVRIHTDARAAESARALNARAYTVGRDVVFNAGEYSPGVGGGRRLLAHELTHVVQQRGIATSSTDAIELGVVNDAHEREADIASAIVISSQQPTPAPMTSIAAGPRLQRSVLGDIGSVLAAPFVALYRLFGGEYYYKETLQKYLTGLKDRGNVENNYDSDNKARACVKRESELGPYDVKIKVLLVREMLGGYTSGGDEGSIIALLRRTATAAERDQIVSTVGRDYLWKNFSGKNRRVIEAITLTAADAKGAALVDRLRTMSEDNLQDYVSNALDPDVKAAAQRAAQLQKITAPVPSTAAVSPQGVASFQVNGVDVTAEPDATSNDENLRNRAVTQFGLNQDKPVSDIFSDSATNTIVSFTPPHLLATVKTLFGPGTEPSGASGYGRGTTAEDKGEGKTSVRFHESRHGQDWFDFLAQNPAPVFGGKVGMSVEDFHKAEQQFQDDITSYNQRATAYSVKKTDCPGTPAKEEELSPFGLTAAICRQQGP
ncbi:MAG: DUF4157 domain-containing protein [Gammaproteobacteria bacterium]|nr:DUF4157 domain-containing protein [Gammaproteobacteria bacterium]